MALTAMRTQTIPCLEETRKRDCSRRRASSWGCWIEEGRGMIASHPSGQNESKSCCEVRDKIGVHCGSHAALKAIMLALM